MGEIETEEPDWESEDPCADAGDEDDDDNDPDDDDEPVDYDPDKCRQKRFRALCLLTLANLVMICGNLQRNRTHPITAEIAFANALVDGHAKAAMLGRQKAGLWAGLSPDDVLLAEKIAFVDAKFASKLIDDIVAGKYDGKEKQLENRLWLYIERLRGTANKGFVVASADATFQWRLGANEDHCESISALDCIQLATGGPNNDGRYLAQDLPTYPGMGDTPCMTNCYCTITRDDGMSGFTKVKR